MLDLHRLRKHRAALCADWKKRGFHWDEAAFEALDGAYRQATHALELKLASRKSCALQHAAHGSEAIEERLRREAQALKEEIEVLKEQQRIAHEAWEPFVLSLPNLLSPSVPEGSSAEENQICARFGTPPSFSFQPQSHEEIWRRWEALGDREAAAVSGSRFAYLYGPLATLHRALGRFMCDWHLARGYMEVKVPEIVRRESLRGSGQLPKFKEDLFALEGDAHYLIPTAEVPLVNLARGQRFSSEQLPLKWMALSSCFRSEVGAYGRDTRGILRQHQFDKVELIQIVAPDQSEAALESLTEDAGSVLTALGLPYQKVALCAGDLGFSAAKTYDLEVWMASSSSYREISSCSNCLDFQARRMESTLRVPSGSPKRWIHTLNGSGVAVGRALAALCECFQTESGNVEIPEILRPYLGGRRQLWQHGSESKIYLSNFKAGANL